LRKRFGWSFSGTRGTGNAQGPMRGRFRGAHSESVSRGAGEGRLVLIGMYRKGKDPA
jgi:hypothetical protein